MARPESLSEDNRGTSISTIKDTKFLNYQNAERLFTAAKKGRDVTEIDIGIEMVEEDETQIG
ncbi:MAG: hypothetical protein ACTHKP_13360 [Nitrososphaeraceae archaeon]